MKIFRQKNSDIFHFYAQNIDCWYSLEPPQQGGSNEYPQSMFWAELRKLMYTPLNPSLTILKWGLRGTKLYRYVFVIYRHWVLCFVSSQLFWLFAFHCDVVNFSSCRPKYMSVQIVLVQIRRLMWIYTVCHSVFDSRLEPIFASMDMSKFKNRSQ